MLTIKYQLEEPTSYYMYNVREICVQEDRKNDRTVISISESAGSNPFDIMVEGNQIAYVMNESGQTVDVIRPPAPLRR